MATWKNYSNKVIKGFFTAVLFGGFLSGFSVTIAFFLIQLSNNLYVADNYQTDKKLGRTVNSYKSLLYNDSDFLNYDYYVIENAQRLKLYPNANRIINECLKLNKPCYNHRLRLDDFSKFHHNKYYYLDDWWLVNCKREYLPGFDAVLRQELSRLPSGTNIIFNEYKFNSFERFLKYFKRLQKDYPNLNLSIGVQIHLQWLDPAFFHKMQIINQIDRAGLPWVVSEFSIYDRLYKPWRLYEVDDLIPVELRQAIANHQAYLVARRCGSSPNCQAFTVWAPDGVWFHQRLPNYRGRFDFVSTPLYWSVRRGLSGESILTDFY